MFYKKFFTQVVIAHLAVNGVHRVDLQTPKKLKILKTFQNLINLFFPPHNGISSHLTPFWINFYPIYMEIMGNQNFEFCTFGPFFLQINRV